MVTLNTEIGLELGVLNGLRVQYGMEFAIRALRAIGVRADGEKQRPHRKRTEGKSSNFA